MVRPADFRAAYKRGKHAGTPLLIVHYLSAAAATEFQIDAIEGSPLVGFVVPKREIKLATRRNRVKRRLRHLMRERVRYLGEGSRTVVHAKAGCVGADSEELGRYLDKALTKALGKEVSA